MYQNLAYSQQRRGLTIFVYLNIPSIIFKAQRIRKQTEEYVLEEESQKHKIAGEKIDDEDIERLESEREKVSKSDNAKNESLHFDMFADEAPVEVF